MCVCVWRAARVVMRRGCRCRCRCAARGAGAEVSLADAREGQVWLVGFEQRAWTSLPTLDDIPAGSAMKQAAHW